MGWRYWGEVDADADTDTDFHIDIDTDTDIDTDIDIDIDIDSPCLAFGTATSLLVSGLFCVSGLIRQQKPTA